LRVDGEHAAGSLWNGHRGYRVYSVNDGGESRHEPCVFCIRGEVDELYAPECRGKSTGSIRQSVTIPASLAIEVRRVAKERHVTTSRALVELAQRGLEAEAAARKNLRSSYRRFMAETEAKLEAGMDLIRAIFAKEAIAEDPVR